MPDEAEAQNGVAGQPDGEGASAAPSGSEPTLMASAVKDPTNLVGREIAGRYRVLERLGEGGMGVVYVAEHLHLKRKVALKVIHPELGANEELLLRFKREALATGQLDHPHIASALDFDQLDEETAFIVMPWVRGHSLQAELDSRGRLDFRRAARLCSQVCDALSAAHALGIVHRDLKHENVLIETRPDSSESVRVLDFGVASLSGRAERISVDTQRPLTQAGTILGTPGYMSPEQATAGEIDHRTDLYAVGVMLWELCRGERLFDGNDVTAIFAKQFKQIPPPLALGASPAARELGDLVKRLLSWNKQDRPATALEVRDQLRRLAEAPDQPTSRIQTLLTGKAAQKPDRGQVVAYAIAALAIVIAVWSWLDTPENAAPEAPPGVSGSAQPAAQGQPQAAALSKELETAIVSLREGRGRDERRDAARLVRERESQAPRFAALMAGLELSSRCQEKKEIIGQMVELGDPRVLPSLERLSDAPRTGCGLIRLSDCYACLRRRLEDALRSLRAAAPQ